MGSHTITLRVTDSEGNVAEDSITLIIEAIFSASITDPANESELFSGQTVSLAASVGHTETAIVLFYASVLPPYGASAYSGE